MHYLIWMNNCFLHLIYGIFTICRVSLTTIFHRIRVIKFTFVQCCINEEWYPVSSWSTEKRKSFLRSLFWSGQIMYLWFGARYGFDGLTLIGYTSIHAAANAVGLMRQHKIGK